MNILTVTMNPAVDQTVTVPSLIPGSVVRADSVLSNAGGKGVNVASCLADWGGIVSAAGVLGQDNSSIFEKMMTQKNIKDYFTKIPGSTRTNIKIVDQQYTTDINLPGLPVNEDIIAVTMTKIGQVLNLEYPDLVVIAGGLPPGCPVDFYARLTARFKEQGLTVMVDASGEALKSCLEADIIPDCIKPNKREFAEACGKTLENREDIIQQALIYVKNGMKLVVVSLGADGAMFISEAGVVMAKGSVDDLKSTVGAGDAMVAGLAAAISENADLERVARLSTAFSVSKLGMPGPNLPARSMVEKKAGAVSIERLF